MDETDRETGSGGSCDYFSLYDADTGTLTEWGEKLREGYEGAVSETRRLDIEYGRLTYREVFEREGIDRETLESDDDKIEPQALLEAEATRRSAGMPVACPHDPVADGHRCKFHLSTDRYEEHGVTSADVCASFVDIINDATGADTERTKCFAGAEFEEISLPYQSLTSTSNRPIQLQYAEIGLLNLDDTVIDERLDLDGSSVRSLSCEHARFRRAVSFERVQLNCQTVSFDNTVFEERVSFRDAEMSATKLEFENCSFESECEFRDVVVDLELAGADPSMIPIVFNQTRFADSFDCSGGEFHVGDDVDRRTQVGVELIQCHFGDEAKFEGCTFGRIAESNSTDEYVGWYDDGDDEAAGETDVEWNLSFNSSTFTGGLQFDEAEIAGHLDLKNIDFDGNVCQFDEMLIDGKLKLNGAEFTQGDVDFSDTEVRGNGSEVSGRCVDCSETSFGRGDLDFEAAQISGDAVFTQASFGQGSLTFAGVDVDGDARFDQTSFSGKRAMFGGVAVGGSLTLEGAVYSVTGGTIDFGRLTVEGGANFRQATFTGNTINFRRIKISGERRRADDWQPPINFRETTWKGGRIDFTHGELGGETTFDLAAFAGEKVVFEEARVTGDFTLRHVSFDTIETVFSGVEVRDADTFDMSLTEFRSDRLAFDSMVLVCDEEITFADATFESDADFSGLEARDAGTFDLSRTTVGGTLTFDHASLECAHVDFSRLSGGDAMLEFHQVTSADAEISFADATVTDGEFEVGGDTVYNFEGATIGDIDIAHQGDGKLFEHFVFRDTEFDGFDFSKNDVKKELKQTGWRIHTSRSPRQSEDEWSPNTRFDFLSRWGRLIREGPDADATHPEQLESTYMKAKLGADQQGDPDTVSQFFQKELHFRRHTYGYQFWDRSADGDAEKNRLGLAWDWITNMTLALTVGYGERPSNVVLTSVVVVFLFSFVYRGLEALPAGSTYIDYLTYSLQGFIQLVVGIQPAGDVLVRLFTSLEGFIGAFVIALFVITLTRSIDR